MGTIRNNVTRMLDAKGVPFEPVELPNKKLGALEVAEFLNVNPARVYKTIVVTRPLERKTILALVPGPSEVDLKALARALGEKKVHLASHKQAEKLTGLQTGGISPLALLGRGFEVVLDHSAERHEKIYVSGGQRGLNLKIAPRDLIGLTGAKIEAIARHP